MIDFFHGCKAERFVEFTWSVFLGVKRYSIYIGFLSDKFVLAKIMDRRSRLVDVHYKQKSAIGVRGGAIDTAVSSDVAFCG